MDGFSYVDIFATKGVEYLLVLVYLLLVIVFLRAVCANPLQEKKAAEGKHREKKR